MKGDLIEKFEKMHKFVEIALLVLGQECNLIFCKENRNFVASG